MKALLKSGEWVEIDTAHLFHDQYNTTKEFGNRRIFDNEIARIVDDARRDMGKCKYCGALVKRGEEEKHFTKRESQSCDMCWWHRSVIVGQPATTSESHTEVDENGHEVTQIIITTKKRTTKKCTYEGEYPEVKCKNRECRRMGIDWFTEDNTFFLRFPNGFRNPGIRGGMYANGFFPTSPTSYEFHKPIGSYTLGVIFEDAGSDKLQWFTMHNKVRRIKFCYEDGEFYLHEWSTWKKSKRLDLPDYAYTAVKKIVSGIYKDGAVEE